MFNQIQLQQLKRVAITEVDRSTLVEIRDVQIDSSLPASQKMERYLEQIGNPYCFLCDGIPVKVRFIAEDKTLKQSLFKYFLSLKSF